MLSLALALFAVLETSVYSEAVYATREDVVASTVRVRSGVPIVTAVQGYAAGGSEAWRRTNERAWDPASYRYGAPGVAVTWGPLALYNEMRFRTVETNDARSTLVAGWWHEENIAKRTTVFTEPYGEVVYTSADDDNAIASGHLRSGVRRRLGKGPAVDAYVEPFATRDRVGHPYNNHADARLGVRLSFGTDRYSASLSGAYVASAALPSRGDELDPAESRRDGTRYLLVLGGVL